QLDNAARSEATPVTALADRWLLSRLSDTVAEVTQAMEEYQFDRALRAIREFSWDVLADEYIELVKGRLYAKGGSRAGAARALALTLDNLCRLLAPFLPHFAEQVYSHLAPDNGSVHRRPWAEFAFSDPVATRDGNRLVRLASELRRYKHDQGLALNAPFGTVTIYGAQPIDDAGDLGRALNATVEWRTESPRLERVVKEVRFQRSVIGPALRKQAGAFMEAVKKLPPEQLEAPPPTVRIDGRDVPVPPGSYTPVFAYRIEGTAVDVVTIGDAVVAIRRAS
ncbi:MAG: class I tRNA ligase family protein, partial [Methanomicrobiales archaeon]|nr:class I tRNA ligase family protein [Methanomicrobiales archaeon]